MPQVSRSIRAILVAFVLFGSNNVVLSLQISPSRQTLSSSSFSHIQEDCRLPTSRYYTNGQRRRNGASPQSSQRLSRRNKTALEAALLPTTIAITSSSIDIFSQVIPYVSTGLAVGAQASLADAIAQKRDKKKSIQARMHDMTPSTPFDFLRNFSVFLYGAMYLGIGQKIIYGHIYPILFGTTTSPSLHAITRTVAFDILVTSTLLCLPTSYIIKSLVYKGTVGDAIRRYKNDIRHNGLLTKFVALWCPVQFVTFGIVPQPLRVPFMATISFIWNIILSSISSSSPSAAAGQER